MNKERKRNKIYYYIDCFFLALPLILFVGGFIWYLSVTKGAISTYSDLEDFASSDWFRWVTVSDELSFLGQYFNNYLTFFIYSFTGRANSFYILLYDSLLQIFDFIGLDADIAYNPVASIASFVFYYSIYIISYEFLSLCVNIVLWLPRHLRNKFQDISEV